MQQILHPGTQTREIDKIIKIIIKQFLASKITLKYYVKIIKIVINHFLSSKIHKKIYNDLKKNHYLRSTKKRKC